MTCGTGMIALWHQHDVAILDGKGLVQLACTACIGIGVDPLERKALAGIQPVIVGLLQIGFCRQIVLIVLVRRIAGGVASGVMTSTMSRESAGSVSGRMFVT